MVLNETKGFKAIKMGGIYFFFTNELTYWDDVKLQSKVIDSLGWVSSYEVTEHELLVKMSPQQTEKWVYTYM